MLYAVLTYLGAIPFVACALLLALGLTDFPYPGAAGEIVRAYGLVIVSFMAGVHWGQQIASKAETGVNLQLTSIAVALIAWGSHLMVGDAAFAMILMALFAALLAIDFTLYQRGVIDRRYFTVRCIVTAIVISSLGVVAASV